MKNQIDSPPQEKPLNDRQMAFARLIVKGMSSGRAYEAAGYDSSGPSADVGGSRLLRNVKVKAHIDKLRARADDKAVLSATERKIWLSRAITTPLSEIDENHPLCVEYTETEKDGNSTSVKIKKVDPLRAMDLLSRLDGAYQPEQLIHIDNRSEIAERVRLIGPLIAGRLGAANDSVKQVQSELIARS